MIELYYWTTPNGHKISIFLEETGMPYELKPVNISAGEQFATEFLAISPNNRIPAIVDRNPGDGGPPLSLFESGAILEYLAEKCGKLLPADPRGRWETLQWLYWQVGGLGPMLGQNHHFLSYAPERIPYAIDRYVKEACRLYRVLDTRLADREFIAGDYSIADIACYPWIRPYERQRQDLAMFPHVARWMRVMENRPAVRRAYRLAEQINLRPTVTDESRKYLFGQTGGNAPQGKAGSP